MAAKVGISYSTFKEWIKRFPAISASLKKGKAPVDTEVENALLKRALGYDYVETVTEYTYSETEKDADGNPKKILKSTRTVTKHVAGEVGAQAFWLKNRRPDRWREKREETIVATAADFSLLDAVSEEIKRNAQ